MISDDASRLSSALRVWIASPHFSDAEVAAAFLLGSLALMMRRQGKLAVAGPIRPPVLDSMPVAPELRKMQINSHRAGVVPEGQPHIDVDADIRSAERDAMPRARLGDFPQLLELLGSAAASKLCLLCHDFVTTAANESMLRAAEIPIAAVFARVALVSLSTKVNVCMHGWLLGRRPCVLTVDRVPYPMEVLRMQASGTRVVTMFSSVENLTQHHVSQLDYMSGHKTHARDPLDFLCHDLLHMELFVNSAGTYAEQVGLFSAIARINPHSFFIHKYCRSGNSPVGELQNGALSHEKQLWHELQYGFSDMNTWAPHLLAYIKAKWTMHFRLRHSSLEDCRGCEDSAAGWQRRFAPCWNEFLREMHVPLYETESTLENCFSGVVADECQVTLGVPPAAMMADPCCCGLYKFWRPMNATESAAVQAFFRRLGLAALAEAGNTAFASVCPFP